MDIDSFWQIIDAANREVEGDPDRIVGEVERQLRALSSDEIKSFQEIFLDKLNEAYDLRLWGAAYLINGGCSDDGFEYFRCWLISRGRKVFETALVDADALIDVVKTNSRDEIYELEFLLYAARKAHRQSVGKEMDGPRRKRAELKGDGWDFDDRDEMAENLPRLTAIYQAG
jgi:hypothetical protein